MLYPQNIEEKLGFHQIRQMVYKECLSTLGQAYVAKMKFSTDYTLVMKLLHQTNEFRSILDQQALFPSQNFINVTHLFDKLRVEGIFLEIAEFFDIKLSLRTIERVMEFFEDKSGTFPHLHALTLGITLDKKILRTINEVIDDKGQMRDDASEALVEIRRSLLAAQIKIRKELERILHAVRKEGLTEEDVSITIRNGRMVIPVHAEHKRKVKGFIHDESASGQTVYIEPAQVLDINNDIRELQYKEQREIIRILTSLSSFLQHYLTDLRKAYIFLGLIDFIRAKARCARVMEAILPTVTNESKVDMRAARHPLLELSLKTQLKSIVPLSIELTPANRILVISGPNAGGKSVALKTTGLLQYMVQCGMLIPVNEASQTGFFQNVLIDIGDEQSIEDDLSTYSSHLTNMKNFLMYGNSKSLILIDEFGTGTEPQLGAAIAEAVLEKLNTLKVFGIITTHYANLKAFSESTAGLINGAMVFNMEKLEPLYQLQIGKPGSSFALEIATKIGLPQEVLNRSRTKIGQSHIDYDQLVQSLEKERLYLTRTSEAIALKEKQLTAALEHHQKLNEDLENNRKLRLNEAKENARLLIANANRKIENTIREIRESNADKQTASKLRHELAGFEKELVLEKTSIPVVESPALLEGPLKIGDYVKITDNGAIGILSSLSDKTAEVMIGNLKSKVKTTRLLKITKKEYRSHHQDLQEPHGPMIEMHHRVANFVPEVDVRGKRGEEALSVAELLIDNAIMVGALEVKIVHGKGDGILRTLIRNHLRSYKQIASLEDDHADRGGAGVTLVRFH